MISFIHGWEFIFLGANIDTVETAHNFGINKENAQNYHADSKGLISGYTAISAAVSAYRATGFVGYTWKDIIVNDIKRRLKK